MFTPSQRLTFLGFELDSVQLKVFLTEDKVEKFLRAAHDLLGKSAPTIREVAGIIGLMVAFTQAFSYGESHLKQLEREKVLQLAKGNYEARTFCGG